MLKRIGTKSAFILLIIVVSIQSVWAEELKAPKWYDTIDVSGFLDGYYSYNFNNPKNRFNSYHNFDFQSNAFSIGLIELNVVKPVDDKNKVGINIGMAFGPTADWVACGSLTCASNAPESPYKNFRQAYASLLILPNLELDFGKFVTQFGAEVIESKDNWNYTRSLLFSWAIPYYHSGARLTYTPNDKFYVMGDVVNGWNNVSENNNGKSYGFQIGITPIKPLPIVLNYITGPENVGAISDSRSLIDALVTYKISDSLSIKGNYDNGIQKQGQGVGLDDAKWNGYALYARYVFTPVISSVIRYEELNDQNGYVTGTVQTLKEVTLTLEHSAPGGTLFRLEYRHDFTDFSPGVFPREDGTATNVQDTLTLGVVQTF